MEKIKSGEIKVAKGFDNQNKHDESKFFKPLADLGIEYKQKDGGNVDEENRHPERIDKTNEHNPTPSKILSTIKKVFVKDKPISLDSLKSKIKEVGSTTYNPSHASADRAASAEDMNKLKNLIATVDKSKPKPVVEETLTTPAKATPPQQGGEDSKEIPLPPEPVKVPEKTVEEKKPDPTPAPAPTPTPVPQKPKEVPEDVLKKILE